MPGSLGPNLRLSWHLTSPGASLPGPPTLVSGSKDEEGTSPSDRNDSSPRPHAGDLTRHLCFTHCLQTSVFLCLALTFCPFGFNSPKIY